MAKVVIISHWYYPALGAAPFRAGNFIKLFMSRGHQVLLITGQKEAGFTDDLPIVKMDLKNEAALTKKILSFKPDLILFTVPPTFGINAIKNLALKGHKVILDIRDPLFYTYNSGNIIKKKLLRIVEKTLIEHSKIAVINSVGIKEIYEDDDVEKIFYYLPNGYDAMLFDGHAEFTRKILYFGAFNVMHSIPNFKKFFALYEKDIVKREYLFDFYCFPSPELNEIRKISLENGWKFLRFFEPITSERFKDKLKDYSLGLTIVKTIYNYSMPSKFYTYLALGIPTMNISFGRSIISRISRDMHLGFDVNPEVYSPDFFDNLENNFKAYSRDVLKSRGIFLWEKLADDFYESEIKCLL